MSGSSNYCWPEARTWAEISLGQIAANWRALRRAAEGVTVAAVVKANAYGHGAVAVARRLEREGCEWFAVSNAAEGAELRRNGIAGRILVMGGFAPFEVDAFFEHRLTPAVHSIAGLLELEARAAALGQRLAVHVKLDTGMGRLGTREPAAAVAGAAARLKHLEIEGVMSHLASASDFSSPQTASQLDAFEAALAVMRGCGLTPRLEHIGSSAAVCYGIRRAFHQMVRVGLALYGYVPAAQGEAPDIRVEVRPALVWRARVVTVKEIAEGEPVGYNARWRAQRPSRLAVVAAGYADGVPHTLAGRGHVVAAGRLAPIVGAVSMDVISVDVTDCGPLASGDPVTLIGQEAQTRHDAADFAREAGLIPYVVLCGLGNRVMRTYTDRG